MLETQKFLCAGGTVEELTEALAIKARPHPTLPLVLLGYSQIDSPKDHPVVRECRGLILERDSWDTVCFGFRRFFNHGEGCADPIDWDTARVQEKLDGSLCQVYHYNGQWQIATRGSPDAGGEVNGYGITFNAYARTAFAETVGVDFDQWAPSNLDPTMCYMFELCGPYNRVVVRHEKPGVTLIGARDVTTLREELASDVAADIDVPCVREHSLSGFDAMLATFDTLPPVENEGYVVVDGQWRRVKVKHPGYVALHHTISRASPKHILDLVRRGEADEVKAHFPELPVDAIQARYDSVVSECEALLAKLSHVTDMKEFASVATSSACPSALFAVKRGKAATVRDFFRDATLQAVMRAVGVEDEEHEREAA